MNLLKISSTIRAIFLAKFLLVYTTIYSQTFKLVDCENSSPITFAHIQNASTGESTISNSDGVYSLKISDKDFILITHVSYQSRTVLGSELNKVLCLEEQVRSLDEVVVEANKIHKLLMTSVQNTQEKLMLPGKLNTYYKEFVKRNDKYTHFCDADVTYHMSEKNGELKIHGSLNESRAYSIPQEHDDEYLDIDLISPIGYRKTMQAYTPHNIGRFISQDAFQNYDYELNEQGNYYLITARAIEEGEGVFGGKVLINIEDSTIYQVQFSIPEERIEHTKEVNAIVARIKVLQNEGYFVYVKNDEGKIYPSFLRLSYDLKIWNKKKINQISSFITDINVYHLPTDQFPIDKSRRFTKKSIYKHGTDFQSNYWQEQNLFNLTEEEKDIIQNMELEGSKK